MVVKSRGGRVMINIPIWLFILFVIFSFIGLLIITLYFIIGLIDYISYKAEVERYDARRIK